MGRLLSLGRWRFGIILAALMLAACVSAIDFATGYDLDVSPFFLIPICWASWALGRRAGLLFALICAAAWLVADLQTGHPYRHAAIPYWNAFMLLCFFSAMVCSLAALQSEMARHKRPGQSINHARPLATEAASAPAIAALPVANIVSAGARQLPPASATDPARRHDEFPPELNKSGKTPLAVILYDSLESLLKTHEILGGSSPCPECRGDWMVNSWRFDMLGNPCEAEKAMEQISRSGLTIIAMGEPHCLDSWPEGWLEHGLAGRANSDAALGLLLVGAASATPDESLVIAPLRCLAERQNLRFFRAIP